MRQRYDACGNAKREALNPRHARLPNLTLQDRAGSAVVHLTTTPRLVLSHPSPRVKSHHGVLVRAPRISRILQNNDLDVTVPRVQTAESTAATNAPSFRRDPWFPLENLTDWSPGRGCSGRFS